MTPEVGGAATESGWDELGVVKEAGGVRNGSILRRALVRLRGRAAPSDSHEYWEWRAKTLGARAVVDVRYDASDLERLTEEQWNLVQPVLATWANGWERSVLDFGCGIGRFTGLLADQFCGEVFAVDPVIELLALAPAHERVHYLPMTPGSVPLGDESVDVLWVYGVLGGLRGSELRDTVSELQRVVTAGGLVVLVENTDTTTGAPAAHPHWSPRGVEDYRALFDCCTLDGVLDFCDFDNVVTVMVGRRRGKASRRVSGTGVGG